MTIGADKIYEIYYQKKLTKKLFLKLIKLDPTTVWKSNIIKPGRYCKWILNQYLKNEFVTFTDTFSQEITDKAYDRIFNALMIFHYWLKRARPDQYNDIFRFNLRNFVFQMEYHGEEYKTRLEFKNKRGNNFTKVYEDDKILILEPLDFLTCYTYSKNTDWCSKSENMYHHWSKNNLLLRFINKETKEIIRLTWSYMNEYNDWSWAAPQYPEFSAREICKNYSHNNNYKPYDFEKFQYQPKPDSDVKWMMKCEKNAKLIYEMHQLMYNNLKVKKALIEHYDQRKSAWLSKRPVTSVPKEMYQLNY
jgi:hypothetical protein